MVCDPIPDVPDHPFPEGFGYRLMTEDDIPLWIDIQRDAEPYLDTEDDLFMKEFGNHLSEAWKRCYMIINSTGTGVGIISAWWDDDFEGSPSGRLHWLAIRPAHQGKGLAKAATALVTRRFKNEFCRAYLSTQSKRAAAIRIYERFGYSIQPR